MRLEDYIRLSLELHLFFDRIMKEHSFFIEASFTDQNANLKPIASNFQREFANILREVIRVSDRNVTRNFLTAEEMVTSMTLEAENKTSHFTNIFIDMDLTKEELRLQPGRIENTQGKILDTVSRLNRRSLTLVKELIDFKQDILNQVLTCKMFTTNYPLLIKHILEEAKLYFEMLSKLERREIFTNNYLYERELFWNEIMMEHAEFIRGLLDPSEKQLILTADKFAFNYESILKKYRNNIVSLTRESLKETIDFQKFKVVGEEGILKCQVRSIILPLLADHVTREANHFIRLLRSFNLNAK